MIIVHHLNNSRSQRILWLLEEMGLPYEIKKYERDHKTMLAPRSLRKLHPLGKSPVLEDGGRIFAESGAIIQYLAEAYPNDLIPEHGTPEYWDVVYWLHYAEGSAMPPLLLHLVFGMLPKRAPLLAKPLMKGVAKTVQRSYINGQIKLQVDFWESHLTENTFFGGDTFGVADIQMVFALEAAKSRMGFDGYPRVTQLLEQLHERPAYKRAIEKGGPYTI